MRERQRGREREREADTYSEKKKNLQSKSRAGKFLSSLSNNYNTIQINNCLMWRVIKKKVN